MPRSRAGLLSAALGSALLAGACGSPPPTTAPPPLASSPVVSSPSGTVTGAAPSPNNSGAAATPAPSTAQSTPHGSVTASVVSVQLPSGLSRAVVLPDGQSLLVLGGLGAGGSARAILKVDPIAGTETAAGQLATPVHDAAGAPLGARWLVLGGGQAVATRLVQVVSTSGSDEVTAAGGQLPAARADGAAIAVDGQVLVVGGGRGGVPDPRVLATRDGVHFRVLGRLAVPVRYGAVAAIGGAVYVFGGTTASGETDAIQRIDPTTGSITLVARLPRPISEAAAFVLGGRILLAGGVRAGRPLRTILAFDAGARTVTSAGQLPMAVADAGAAVIGDAAYLVGGETGTRYLSTVIEIR